MTLPPAISRYLEAANRFDAVEAVKCFTPGARVHDESHDYLGSEAIRDWIHETSEKYRPQFEVKHCELKGGQVSLKVEVSGTFPGSPIELDYHIAISAGLISELIVQ
jgi:hypothetical protein